MGAPNFSNQNASKIYAVELARDVCYEFLFEDIRNVLEEEFTTDFIKKDEWDSNRNYEGKIIAEINKSVEDEQIIVSIIIRSGYHDGANLDWDARFFVIEDNYQEEYDLDCIDIDKFPKVREEFNKIIDRVEKIYSKLSTPLKKVAQLSNGEAIYQKD